MFMFMFMFMFINPILLLFQVFPLKFIEGNTETMDTIQTIETLVHNPCTVFLSLIQKLVRKVSLFSFCFSSFFFLFLLLICAYLYLSR